MFELFVGHLIVWFICVRSNELIRQEKIRREEESCVQQSCATAGIMLSIGPTSNIAITRIERLTWISRSVFVTLSNGRRQLE
jgi:hypothetical protein